MKLIELKHDILSIILGLEQIKIEEPPLFLSKIKNFFPKLVIQILNAKFIAGYEHIKSIIQQSFFTFLRNISYTKSLDLEILVRFACDTQIKRALENVGLKSNIMDLVFVAIGKQEDLNLFKEYLSNLGKFTDRVFKLTITKKEFLIQYHNISPNILKTTLISKNKLALILSEKALLLRK